MKLIPTSITDVLLFEPKVFGDERGFFMETFRQSDFEALFAEVGMMCPSFVQENMSRSQKHVLRGLHYQEVHPQGKLIRVTAGSIFDVAVDIRNDSKTFGQWFGQVLSAENRLQMYIPPGFAHGFFTLSEYADIIYKCTDYYTPEFERVIAWNDPQLNIQWPLEEGVEPVLSEKDKKAEKGAMLLGC
ncbi:dTDP-4-dehydrorhamnose 3,5-epimerase [Shewanella schlegeliana]|uniref:dTDP-4-dehydrorhamnose 3,5-epimerase n=1 Tax=Shewanella schlegeliana TaxID=190308 RepID=A0ABS1SSX2_9GAMM|nr:dTDP-4-dehydrorhamnose 3,5-epimerase [Shewanella schlegeliana]MBL4911637.1 dTDP-4-dehydrorhamnose 3,5-epimerase [Shewanella schlegeliana]MCL1111679.1 dTDP-4-dehydrorhamnose 3,5-epimerase [Shewanella schlegeliana]GIU36898.1 dTDP-4-dehydrorhamnose 3,5-epimerase [Shewanella schlegeliana]